MPSTHRSAHSFINERASRSGQLVLAERGLTVGARLVGGPIQIEVDGHLYLREFQFQIGLIF